MKIFHVDRDYSKSIEQQKRELKSQYADFSYLFADHANGNAKVHFVASGRIEEVEEG